MLSDPLEFASWGVARRLAEKWDLTLEREMRDLLIQGCYTDALLIAQELHDRLEHGLTGELCDRPERVREENIARRASMVQRIIGATAEPERPAEEQRGEGRRAQPGGPGVGPRAERRLERLTSPAGTGAAV